MDAPHRPPEIEITTEAEVYAPIVERYGRYLYELAADISESEDSNATIDDDATEMDRHVSDSEADDEHDSDVEITGVNVLEEEVDDEDDSDVMITGVNVLEDEGSEDTGSDSSVLMTGESSRVNEVQEGVERRTDAENNEPIAMAAPLRRNPVYGDEYQAFPTTRGTLRQAMKVDEAAISDLTPPLRLTALLPVQSIEQPERTYTVAFQLPSADQPTKVRLPFSASFYTLLDRLRAVSVPVARQLCGNDSIGFTLKDGPWFYSIIKGHGTQQRMETQVRCLNSNLQYLAMVSEMSRAKANFALFWHAKVRYVLIQSMKE